MIVATKCGISLSPEWGSIAPAELSASENPNNTARLPYPGDVSSTAFNANFSETTGGSLDMEIRMRSNIWTLTAGLAQSALLAQPLDPAGGVTIRPTKSSIW